MQRPVSGRQTRVPSQSSSDSQASTQARSTHRRPVKQSSSFTQRAASKQNPSAQVCAPGQSLLPSHSSTAPSGGMKTSGSGGAISRGGENPSVATEASILAASRLPIEEASPVPDPPESGAIGMGVGLLSPHPAARSSTIARTLKRTQTGAEELAPQKCLCNIKTLSPKCLRIGLTEHLSNSTLVAIVQLTNLCGGQLSLVDHDLVHPATEVTVVTTLPVTQVDRPTIVPKPAVAACVVLIT